MLTRVLFAVGLICGTAAAASAEESKALALGLADHEVSQAELETGETPPAPHFNTPAVAYVLAADLKKGDVVEITLMNNHRSLLSNSETLPEDQARYLLQAGKRGVPAGGWPEGNYRAALKITRDGKTLVEQATDPIPFD
jgi:hypothetical protein